MSKNWTEKDLKNKGLTIVGEALKKHGHVIFHRGEGEAKIERESILVIDGIVDGLNGPKGLMRSHWTTIAKIKNLYALIIHEHLKNGKVVNHPEKVSIEYIGYKSALMDWDNFCASFKHIGDSLVDMGVIIDDKPSIVKRFIVEQIKCKRKEQRVVIVIKDI